MKPIPRSGPYCDADISAVLYFNKADYQELMDYFHQFIRLEADLPKAETQKSNIVETYKYPLPSSKFFCEEDYSPIATFEKQIYKRAKTIVYGMVFQGWQKI